MLKISARMVISHFYYMAERLRMKFVIGRAVLFWHCNDTVIISDV